MLLFIIRLGRPLLRYFYMQAAMPAHIIYYMYVSTFVWVLPYVRSMIASLLVKIACSVIIFYYLSLFTSMYIYVVILKYTIVLYSTNDHLLDTYR